MTVTSALPKHRAVSPAAPAAQEITWLSPEAKLWVANRGREFAGFVEFRDGHYESTDERGHQLEARATLREAKAQIAKSGEPVIPSALLKIAVVTGGIAVGVFGAGLGVLWLS